MRERHGIADAKRSEHDPSLQHVTVSDGDGEVRLNMGSAASAAGMTPEQALMIAKCLTDSAERVKRVKNAKPK